MPAPARFPRRWRALVVALGFAVGTIVAAGCFPPPPPPPPPITATTVGVTHAVSVHDVTFVDTSRPTPAFGAYPGSSSRELPTTIWYPSDGGGPFPLVMFVHGYAVTPEYYEPLLSRIAAAGYVVAAPTYPLLSGQPAGPTEGDWDDLYPDTWFATSQVLDLSASGDPTIGGLVDPERVAVAGHSDGAAVAFGLGYTPFRLDPRVRAVVAYAADVSVFGEYQPNERPILHFLSDQDQYNPYDSAIAWDRDALQQPKTVVSLWNASHAEPFVDPGDAHFELVVEVTLGFLDANLKAHPEELYFSSTYVGDHPDIAMME